ncbi:hypothetical protein L3X38_010344 [Prunus dulcis]|uniref:Uncharacterized protein n=1 Tax=Prunus dulcis TaxID=3755 RepID=A0AAD4WGY5_PRUDU|nr:hypothetical protein L3X38_010344 [Prunus dulcis]
MRERVLVRDEDRSKVGWWRFMDGGESDTGSAAEIDGGVMAGDLVFGEEDKGKEKTGDDPGGKFGCGRKMVG